MSTIITTRARPPTARNGKAHHGNGAIKFVGIDGEGMTMPDGSHRYVLIRLGTNPPLENPNGLYWRRIFEYLYSYRQDRTAYVGFYLGYDFTQVLKTLTEDRARKLLLKAEIAKRKSTKYPHREPMPVESQGWQFDFGMGGRRLRIRPKPCKCPISYCKCPKEPWMYICDAGGFFQTSFLVAINPAKWPTPVVTDDEFATIRQGKESRASAVLDDDMRFYNKLENDVMARLMARTDEGLRNLGVTLSPKQWFSPAQAAQQWMRGRVPDRETIDKNVPAAFREAARASYFGGWFEIFMHGRIPGIVYQYDINSAYPTHAYRLPCLIHGKWDSGSDRPSADSGYVLARIDVTVPKGIATGQTKKYIGAMPHRTAKGKICRPIFTSGWYWLSEIRAAERTGCARVTKWHEWMRYDPCDCPSPLRELAGLYQERLRQGKNTPLGRGARLVYNCVYGKLCQSVGDPEFMNFVYASLITSGCRIQILDAIATHPEGKSGVVQVATDAVYFRTPHPSLPQSDKLGDWEETQHSNMTVFKPGVYWDDTAREMIAAGKAPQFKARGVSARDMATTLDDIDRQFDAWNGKVPKMLNPIGGKMKGWPGTAIKPSFAMITALQALMRNDWSLAGTLMDNDLHQSSNPGDKRQDAYFDKVAGVYRSEPIKNGSAYSGHLFASEPYRSEFGQENPDNPMSDENRDAYGLSPDGMIGQLTVDAMMPDRKWAKDVR
jgi:hypothetical protein